MAFQSCIFKDSAATSARPSWRVRVNGRLLPGAWVSRQAARAGLDAHLAARRARLSRAMSRLRLPGWRVRRLRASYLERVAVRQRLSDALVGADSAGERLQIVEELDAAWAEFGRMLFGPGGRP